MVKLIKTYSSDGCTCGYTELISRTNGKKLLSGDEINESISKMIKGYVQCLKDNKVPHLIIMEKRRCPRCQI